MTAIEEMAQCFEHSAEEREKLERSYFRAEVLRDNRQLFSAGRAIFEFERAGRGMFFPDGEILHGEKLQKAAILKSFDGTEFVLQDFELCPTVGSPHYHFRFEPMKPDYLAELK